jgi:hypothetical protein
METNKIENKPAERCGEIAICRRCNRARAIYNITKQLCGSCRILEPLHKDKKKYAELLEKQRERYKDEEYRKMKHKYNKRYYSKKENAEKMKETARRYWREHKELCNENKRKWKKANSEKHKAWLTKYYAKNKDKILTKNKTWREANAEKIKKYRDTWRFSEKGRKYMKEYYLKHNKKNYEKRKKNQNQNEIINQLNELKEIVKANNTK